MAEISLLADQFGKMGLLPADIVAVGAALTAAAAAMLVAKEALHRINTTEEERIAKANASAHEAEAILNAVNETIDKSFTGAAEIIKEVFVAGSILPDKV